jgi:hypothetical protein
MPHQHNRRVGTKFQRTNYPLPPTVSRGGSAVAQRARRGFIVGKHLI